MGPEILTLDGALGLRDPDAPSENERVRTIFCAYHAIIDRIETRYSVDAPKKHLKKLSTGERLVWQAEHFSDNARCDGLAYAFENCSNTREIIAFLRDIGATTTADILDEASSLTPNSIPVTLTGGFYRSIDDELPPRVLDYVERNRSEFVVPTDDVVERLRYQRPIHDFYLTPKEKNSRSKRNAEIEMRNAIADAFHEAVSGRDADESGVSALLKAHLKFQRERLVDALASGGKEAAAAEFLKFGLCSPARAEELAAELEEMTRESWGRPGMKGQCDRRSGSLLWPWAKHLHSD